MGEGKISKKSSAASSPERAKAMLRMGVGKLQPERGRICRDEAILWLAVWRMKERESRNLSEIGGQII